MDRFFSEDDVVIDTQNGLMWPRDAALTEFPLTWNEAFSFVEKLNRDAQSGYNDWRLPNRRELLSLLSHNHINPSLPQPHPFVNIFHGYYWTSTTCVRLPRQAWYIHLGGARVFKGLKQNSYMVWPVRVANPTGPDIFQTGQQHCYDDTGETAGCKDTGQDGEFQAGRRIQTSRFSLTADTVLDRATGRTWLKNIDSRHAMLNWQAAFESIDRMNRMRLHGFDDWRLPTILELESLTDMGRHSPSLPHGHPFSNVQEFYWSSTTSMYDTDYAWVLYLQDGAVGVGYKRLAEFYLWPVRAKHDNVDRTRR